MPKLNCSVSNCGNNEDSCCCLGNIEVDGGASAENTCCSNFTDQVGASNNAGTPHESLTVGCSAHDCTHNSSGSCGAESINVAGAGATNSVDTQCSSYCQR